MLAKNNFTEIRDNDGLLGPDLLYIRM